MGWLIRYTGRKKKPVRPGGLPDDIAEPGVIIDVKPTADVRAAVKDKKSGWQRVTPRDKDYIAVEDR